MIFRETQWAVLHEFANEYSLDGKEGVDDPVKWRVSTPVTNGSGYLGALTGSVNVGSKESPIYREKIIIALKRGTGDRGVLEFFCQRPNTTEDIDMVRVFELDTSHAQFFVPVFGQFMGAIIPHVTRFYTDQGKFMCNWQDDTGQPTGILYRIVDPANEGTWVPVGKVRIDPL